MARRAAVALREKGYAPGDPDPSLYAPPWEHGFEDCFSVRLENKLAELSGGRIGLVYEARGHRDIVLRRYTLQQLIQ